MYCNDCGKEFQPWVDITHYTDERGNTPVLIYQYCNWNCPGSDDRFCINCGIKISKRGNIYLCSPCRDICSGEITYPKKLPKIERCFAKSRNVYFFQIENNGPIKVGIAENPLQRLKQIQGANPYKVNFLFSFLSNLPIESYIKDNFRDTLMCGEWYKSSKKLLTLIKNFRIGEALNLDPKDLLI